MWNYKTHPNTVSDKLNPLLATALPDSPVDSQGVDQASIFPRCWSKSSPWRPHTATGLKGSTLRFIKKNYTPGAYAKKVF